MSRTEALRATIHELYEGTTRPSVRFRYGLLAFDTAMIVFIVVSSFTPGNPVTEVLDFVFGAGVLG
jgi:voltage-gated potassium channel